jgi:O-antigen chain-terminating methyltransferase
MAADDDRDKIERERLAADRQYNEALTAFDAAVAACGGRPLERADFDRLAHTLIQFLQQITAYLDTKDRAAAADVRARLDLLERLRAETDELTTRLNVLQRTVGSRQVTVDSRQPGAAGQPPIANRPPPIASPPSDAVYVAFEDAFRGSDAAVASKVASYVPIFAGARDVVDLGCGRGEFLAALTAAGVSARGVDTNAEMVAIARERGLDVRQNDALTFVAALEDASIGGAIATQVIEHLEPSYLVRLLETLARKLQPGAPLVLETINPACWLAFFSSYIRDFTHVRPIHPETLQYLLRAAGFGRVDIRYSAPVPDAMKLRTIDLPASVLSGNDQTSATLAQLGHTINAHATTLNNLLFTHMDYAALGYRI